MAPESDFHTDANGNTRGNDAERNLTRRENALVEVPERGAHRMEKTRPAALTAPPTPMELAKALQRRWLLALVLAICCAIPPAALAWYFVPVTYSTKAWLRADSSPRMFDTKTETDTSLSTHQVLIRSPYVMNAALREPGVSSLPTIQDVAEKNIDVSDWLASKVSVQVGRSSEYMIIGMTGEEPQDVQRIVKAVTRAYLDRVVNKERADRVEKRNSLERTYRERTELIRQHMEDMAITTRELGTADEETAQQKQNLLIDFVGDLRKEHGKLKSGLRAKEREMQFFERMYEVDEKGVPAITPEILESYAAEDPEVVQLRRKLENEEKELQAYLAVVRNPEEHAKVQSINRRIQSTRDQADAREQAILAGLTKQRDEGTLKTPLQEKYDLLQLEKAHLEAELATVENLYLEYSQKIDDIGTYSADLAEKKSAVARQRSVVGSIGLELEKLSIEMDANDRIQLIQEAELPKTPDTGKRDKLTLLCGLGGIGLALLGVAFFEFHTRRITNYTAVEDGLGVRVMGDVPMLSGKRWSLFGGVNGEGALQGMMDESIDGIRSMLLHAGGEQAVRCVLVTSAKAGEGKTTVASSLAASIGRSGRRTLLVDGDLRRPSVHRLLDIPNRAGLSEVLSGEATVADVVHPSRSPGLWVMTAGQCTPECLHALAREGVGEVFDQLREEFDFIVVDSGPVLAVVDPLLLGPYTDGAIVSVVRRVSQMSSIYETCERLDGVGVRVLGSVINGASTGRFGFDYYGYGYGYGYGSVNGGSNADSGHYETAGSHSNGSSH